MGEVIAYAWLLGAPALGVVMLLVALFRRSLPALCLGVTLILAGITGWMLLIHAVSTEDEEVASFSGGEIPVAAGLTGALAVVTVLLYVRRARQRGGSRSAMRSPP
jgi:hypothetical protein